MTTLLITLHFMDDRFYGQADNGPEWPPSPFRLFQAMLAASSRHGNETTEIFQWLEKLPQPDILAPEGKGAKPFRIYVPNNDSDKKHARQDRLAEKSIQPVRFPFNCPVHYLWSIKPDDIVVAKKAADQAALLCAVGWGIDLVAGNGRILTEFETDKLIGEYPGCHWKPVSSSYKSVRCPKPGSLKDLQEVYQSFLNRFEGNVYRPARKPAEFDEVAYAKTGLMGRRFALFRLLKFNDDSDRWENFDQRKALEVAAWVRGYVCKASREGEFPGDSETYVAGHVPKEEKNGLTPPRFSYFPIPSIGHDYADGRVRRFMIAEPYGGDGRFAQWARRILSNAVLMNKDGIPQTRLQAMARPDSVIHQYIREARTFQTVTPVILPGYDDMKYQKTAKLFKKSLEQAGLPLGHLEDLYLQKAPFKRGSYGPQSYKLPDYLKGKPAIHARLTLKEPVLGPLAIGAGRHLGLGLFAAEAEKE